MRDEYSAGVSVVESPDKQSDNREMKPDAGSIRLLGSGSRLKAARHTHNCRSISLLQQASDHRSPEGFQSPATLFDRNASSPLCKPSARR